MKMQAKEKTKWTRRSRNGKLCRNECDSWLMIIQLNAQKSNLIKLLWSGFTHARLHNDLFVFSLSLSFILMHSAYSVDSNETNWPNDDDDGDGNSDNGDGHWQNKAQSKSHALECDAAQCISDVSLCVSFCVLCDVHSEWMIFSLFIEWTSFICANVHFYFLFLFEKRRTKKNVRCKWQSTRRPKKNFAFIQVTDGNCILTAIFHNDKMQIFSFFSVSQRRIIRSTWVHVCNRRVKMNPFQLISICRLFVLGFFWPFIFSRFVVVTFARV